METLNTIFHKSDLDIGYLIKSVENNVLGLPDLQRQYVWTSSQVRNLLDSMLRGYPIGYILLWESQTSQEKTRSIGLEEGNIFKDKVIIDGQQRITSLYAVVTGNEIRDKNSKKTITISFNPIEKEFKVWNASIEKDPEWIANVTDIFKNESNSRSFINNYIKRYNEYRTKRNKEAMTESEEQMIEDTIKRVLDLKKFPIYALVIDNTVDEEDVAEVFVRVNSGGTKLNENDFILTLMSVVSPELRDKIEKFCSDTRIPSKERTSYNNLIELEPQHIIRTATSFVFKRGRLKYAYRILRGNELKRGANNKINLDLRKENFDKFSDGLDKLLNLDNWKNFIKAINSAGFINNNMIGAKNTLVYCYTMFLIGKYDFKLEKDELRKIIAKWFFMTSTVSYYTGNFESKVESDLNDIQELTNGNEFIEYINKRISDIFTEDYFKITLPNVLRSSSTNTPAWYTYLAALNILQVKVLFSELFYNQLLCKEYDGNRKALEKHHLFPKGHLSTIGYTTDKERNQIANYAYIEWEDNNDISDTAPKHYFPQMFDKNTKNLSNEEKEKILYYNALPKEWYLLEYKDFLNNRRSLMAKVIKDGYDKLS